MTKTYRRLWPQLVSFDNLLLAFQHAAARDGSNPDPRSNNLGFRCEVSQAP